MATLVPVPKLGQSEETVIIDSWRAKEGDVIKKGDVLFEVETDKAVLEVGKFACGLLHPDCVGIGCASGKVDSPCSQFHDEQQVEG